METKSLERIIKSVGRCFSRLFTGRHRWKNVMKQQRDGVRFIDETNLIA